MLISRYTRQEGISKKLFTSFRLSDRVAQHNFYRHLKECLELDFLRSVTKCFYGESVHTQAINSAPVNTNASMYSLELKVPAEELEDHLRKIRHINVRNKEEPLRKAKEDKASKAQQTISVSEKELRAITIRNKKWTKGQDQRP
ncbi:hypothetical protein [uncultured Aquimarina sp.]|uniref:hypothetical protein n=1 Tax=uncultured Aquimarina sp. TaxID=575652 RepID=UPI00260A257D|nr:hypothetical protein [uncultured Aquimarina sp.]